MQIERQIHQSIFTFSTLSTPGTDSMASERKQVKKFLKPKIGGEEAEPPAKGKHNGVIMLVLGAVAVAAVAVWYASTVSVPSSLSTTSEALESTTRSHTPLDPSAVRSDNSPQKSAASAPSKKDNSIPTYDEYVKQAKRNKWLPTDPVLKLESSILKYSQLFDVVDTTDTKTLNHFLQMMSQEMQYLLAVLTQSTDRTIDLTPALRSAIDIIPEITYRFMKLQLSSGQITQTTRAQVTNNLQHWVYSPLRELIKVMATKPIHILMDVNQVGAEAALVRVVKHRLYGLISVFLSLGSSPATVREALRVAVHQGDDLGVALVLNAMTGPNGAASIPNHALLVADWTVALPELQSLAQQLRFDYIATRIGGAIDRLAGKIDPPVPGVIPADKADIFNQYFPYQRLSVSASALSEKNNDAAATGEIDPTSGYTTFQLHSVYSVDTSDLALDIEGTQAVGYINQCDIDRVNLADLSPQRFYNEYVLLNRPVLLHRSAPTINSADALDTTDTLEEATNKVWRLENLLRRFGSTEEVSSIIPYATLFGHKEEIVSLRDFVADPVTGMHAYTQRLQQEVAKLGTFTLSEAQLLEVAAAVGLPRYIFSGMQQNMNRAMRKHMLKSVLQYTSPSTGSTADTSTSEEVHRLLDLMHTVSRTYNYSTTAATRKGGSLTHTDFKPHWKSQFYLGPALSGAPFHHHGPAFNLLMHGRKEWTLMPPGRDVYSSLHPLDWLREGGTRGAKYPYHADSPTTVPDKAENADIHTLRTDQPCKVIQSPGEVLFVPRHWTHQILNLGESVGFAVEIDDYAA